LENEILIQNLYINNSVYIDPLGTKRRES